MTTISWLWRALTVSTLSSYGRVSSRFPAKVAIDFIEYERRVCKYSFQMKCRLRTSSVISETCFSPLAALLTVFSILLHTEFYTFPRQHLHTASQSSRITDLLERYGLQEKYWEGKILSNGLPTDWNGIDKISVSNKYILEQYLKDELEKRF